jgi:hypothetical protein
MSCDLCKHEHDRTDILCEPCRDMIARLTTICRRNPEVLSMSEPASQAGATNTWWAEAGAQ